MVVRKVGGQNLNKKKNVEEAKKMAEKKKLMMKEEESEEEDMSEDDDEIDEDVSDETEESEDMEDTEDEDSDDEESMDEEGMKKPNKSKDFGQGFIDKRGVNKTPAKTPSKAANKTPAKTPNKSVLQQNSQKKQMESKTPKTPKQQNISKLELSPSPKKTDNLKTPSSVKQQKVSGSAKKKPVEVDDDDEDDDDEEDDDDDDEEEEEEDEDGDDEEEEEEEEEEENEDEKKQVKGGDEEEEEEEDDEEDEQPQAKKPKKDFPTVDLKNTEQQRRSDRDCRSLYVRGFPVGTTEEEIKTLSPDIVAVRIPMRKRKVHNTPGIIFAFLEFASEKAAEENFSVIEKKKFKGKDLFVDFVGGKSKNKSLADKSAAAQRNVNKLKLFVSSIPKQATMEDIGKAFPAAISVFVNSSGANKTAQVLFANEEDAAEAFKSSSSLKMRGVQVVVLYALINKHRGGGRGKFSPRKQFNQGGPGFRKPFQNQRRPPFKQQNFDD